MQIAIISTGLGIVLFLCLYLGFRTGLKLGKVVADGKDIPKIKSPVSVFNEHKKAKEEKLVNDEYEKKLLNLMNYNGDPQGE